MREGFERGDMCLGPAVVHGKVVPYVVVEIDGSAVCDARLARCCLPSTTVRKHLSTNLRRGHLKADASSCRLANGRSTATNGEAGPSI